MKDTCSGRNSRDHNPGCSSTFKFPWVFKGKWSRILQWVLFCFTSQCFFKKIMISGMHKPISFCCQFVLIWKVLVPSLHFFLKHDPIPYVFFCSADPVNQYQAVILILTLFFALSSNSVQAHCSTFQLQHNTFYFNLSLIPVDAQKMRLSCKL